MTKIKVTKLNLCPGEKNTCIIDSNDLGHVWTRFFLHTQFCKILPKFTDVNRTSRVGYNGFIYIVEANDRKLVYDSNFLSTDRKYKITKDFVNYVLSLNKCVN